MPCKIRVVAYKILVVFSLETRFSSIGDRLWKGNIYNSGQSIHIHQKIAPVSARLETLQGKRDAIISVFAIAKASNNTQIVSQGPGDALQYSDGVLQDSYGVLSLVAGIGSPGR